MSFRPFRRAVPIVVGKTDTGAVAIELPSTSEQRTLHLDIAGGSSRDVDVEIRMDAAAAWVNVLTSTAIGGTVMLIPATTHVRVNVVAVTGSTINAWVSE